MITKSWFESRVNKIENGCWIWKAGMSHGYGAAQIDNHGKTTYAHRLSLHLYNDFDLNSELFVLHKTECNNRACVNPEHLYTGDSGDNARDVVKAGNNYNANKTHCPQGHEYSMENTYYEGNKRKCKMCNYYRAKKRRENK